jgi:hypothetical protein
LYRQHGQNNTTHIFADEKLRLLALSATTLARHLASQGVCVTPELWNGSYQSWLRQINMLAQELTSILQPADPYVLVDGDEIRTQFLGGRKAIPFLECQGTYWGPPPDDATGIQEVKRLRQAGAKLIVFAWPAFWWLDHYFLLEQYLRSTFPCLLENEQLVVFDLRL